MHVEPIQTREPRRGIARRLLAVLAACLLVLIFVAAVGYANALASPIERHLRLDVPGYPAAERPLKLILFSDVHVHGPDMPPARVQRIVDLINKEQPDAVVIAGDFIGDNWIGAHFPIGEAVAPLARLRAPLGVYAVLGNNDHVAGGTKITKALRAAHVTVLKNQVARVGPIILGGVDYRLDRPRDKALVALYATLDLMAPMKGPKVLVAHSPDIFPSVPPSVSLVLAGHTHCGQVAIPYFGALLTGSYFGREFACGVYRARSRLLIVTAGLGTSHVPIRFAAPPDLWVIEIGG